MPTVPRLYHELPLTSGAESELGPDAATYLGRVLRRGLGDTVRLFNPRDGEWLAEITSAGARGMKVKIRERLRPAAERAGPALTLLFAPVKKDATDLIIEKATELGAARIQPVLTVRSQTRTVRADRFRKIALEAAEQSERLDIPEILDLMPLEAALSGLAAGVALVFCDEAGDDEGAPWGGRSGRAKPVVHALQMLAKRDAALLIGPEGGFTPQERAALRARDGVFPVSLGPRILRAETAAIAAMSIWQAICGDWQSA